MSLLAFFIDHKLLFLIPDLFSLINTFLKIAKYFSVGNYTSNVEVNGFVAAAVL